jgi:hypothetical protein
VRVLSTAALDYSRSGSARTRLGGRFFLRGFDIGDGLLWTVACQDVPQLAPTASGMIYPDAPASVSNVVHAPANRKRQLLWKAYESGTIARREWAGRWMLGHGEERNRLAGYRRARPSEIVTCRSPHHEMAPANSGDSSTCAITMVNSPQVVSGPVVASISQMEPRPTEPEADLSEIRHHSIHSLFGTIDNTLACRCHVGSWFGRWTRTQGSGQ